MRHEEAMRAPQPKRLSKQIDGVFPGKAGAPAKRRIRTRTTHLYGESAHPVGK